MDEIPKPMRDGSPPAIVEVQGIAFTWIGTLSWGHQPFGSDPTLWECGQCKASTASPGPHSRQHGKERRLWTRVMARVGLTDDGKEDPNA